MNLDPGQCYESCNQKYSAMQPERLFCKKGCDSEEESLYMMFDDRKACRTEHCNKICIKEEQGDQKLWFKFLYRAPSDPAPCLESCIQGCTFRISE